MSTMATNLVNTPSPEDLRKRFETAIAQIQRSGGPSDSSRTTIAFRWTVEQAAEKRTLTDAARALAGLWKVSPRLVR